MAAGPAAPGSDDDGASGAPECLSLVPAGSRALVAAQEYALVPNEARLARLREDREVHSYKQIWTKDPHGGPYRKAAGKPYDPLLHLPDGTPRQMELGYERVERGPTTNFVGNHMTQGAIDLVQAELERPSTDHMLLLLEQGQPGEGPQLLGVSPAAQPAQTLQRSMALSHYSWWDGGEAVCVRLDLGRCRERLRAAAGGGGGGAGGAAGEPLRLSWRFEERSVRLQLAGQQQTGESDSTGGGEADGSSALLAPTLQLLLDPLCHSILPERCSIEVAGPLALPAADAAAEASAHAAAAGAHAAAGDAAAAVSPVAHHAAAANAAPSAAASATVTAGAGSCTAQAEGPLPIAPTATALLLRLHKADPSLGEWPSLHGSLAVAAQREQQGQPDLAALRRAVRRQRQGAAGRPTSTQQEGSAVAPAAPAAEPGAEPAAGEPGMPPTPDRSLDSLLSAARHSMQAGQHQDTIDTCTALLQHWGPQLGAAAAGGSASVSAREYMAAGTVLTVAEAAGLVEALSLRADCHCHMGGLKQAVADYSTALELLERLKATGAAGPASPAPPAIAQLHPDATRLLLARAAVYEQLEQYGQALEDLRRVATAQQPAVDTQVALGIQRVGRSLREAQRVQERQRGQGGAGASQPPSVPRQSQLAQAFVPKGIRL